jgi:hypothetical protein
MFRLLLASPKDNEFHRLLAMSTVARKTFLPSYTHELVKAIGKGRPHIGTLQTQLRSVRAAKVVRNPLLAPLL